MLGLLRLTHHVRQVGSPIELGVRLDDISTFICVTVDESGHSWQLGNDVNAVL